MVISQPRTFSRAGASRVCVCVYVYMCMVMSSLGVRVASVCAYVRNYYYCYDRMSAQRFCMEIDCVWHRTLDGCNIHCRVNLPLYDRISQCFVSTTHKAHPLGGGESGVAGYRFLLESRILSALLERQSAYWLACFPLHHAVTPEWSERDNILILDQSTKVGQVNGRN